MLSGRMRRDIRFASLNQPVGGSSPPRLTVLNNSDATSLALEESDLPSSDR